MVVTPVKAVDPNLMYLLGFGVVFDRVAWAVGVTAVFVITSQLKINVTNAYAGSLAWSNFFSRQTHSHKTNQPRHQGNSRYQPAHRAQAS